MNYLRIFKRFFRPQKLAALQSLSLAFLLLSGVPSSSYADELEQSVLSLAAGKNKSYYEPRETLQIDFSKGISVVQFHQYVLELDSIDISEMIKLDNRAATFNPVQAMMPGQHELRVVEYAQDGSINEKGVWAFEVRQSALFQDYSVAVDTQFSSNYRTAEENIGVPQPDRLQSQATSQFGFSTTNGNWHSQGQFDLFYTSVAESRPTARSVDNSVFLLSAGNEYINAKIGHQSVGATSLVSDNFNRRGVSLEYLIPDIDTRITGFSLSSRNISGFSRGLGIGNPQQRVDGFNVDSNPIDGDSRKLYLSATWLEGRGDDSGLSISNVDDISTSGTKGDAWSISGESLLMDNRLRLRAEYAASNFDFNPLDSFAAEADTAHNILAIFSDSTESGMSWNSGISFQKVGTFFRSLGNQNLPSDREISKIFGATQWSTFGVQANLEQQTDNVENLPQLPQITTDLGALNMNWSPVLENTDSWMGSPSFSAGYNTQSQEQTYTPLDYFFPAANNQVDSFNISSMFSYPKKNWGITLMNTEFTDKSQIQNDTDTSSIDLSSQFLFSENFNLAPSIRFDRTRDKVTSLTTESVTYSFQTAFIVLPKELDGTLYFVMNKNQTSDDSVKGTNLSLNFSLNWHLRETKPNSIGVDMALNGTYNDFADKLFQSNSFETYQLFLSINVLLPSRAGREQ